MLHADQLTFQFANLHHIQRFLFLKGFSLSCSEL